MEKNSLSLPMVSPLTTPSACGQDDAAPAASWEGYTIPRFETATDAPEPDLPQGEYRSTSLETPWSVPLVEHPGALPPVELLAPAGGLEAAFAAFHYGADAIYLGLKKFSARAEAENFTFDELEEVTAFAHQLMPRRRIFVTINTLIRQDELSELVEALAAVADVGVDAVIIQDWGVYHTVRSYFPKLELHASTQLAVHNRAGAEALKQLGFSRVVLARELTFEEVRDITATAGIETEVFIHGALCYSYSGLCLFSSQTLGRSGNRGKCAYSCRDAFEVSGAPETLRDGQAVKRSPAQGFPFSMKDLALPDHLPALQSAGVSCFKIEGRKKSPLYVATTTDYYRRLLDGHLDASERPRHEADLQTVFSRPWTGLFLSSHKDKEVADRDTVGHRGTWIGTVKAVRGAGGRTPRLSFQTARALERHDGLQIDLPVLGKPFGFAVEQLWHQGHEVFEVPADSWIEVALPADHPPLPVGAPIYCSSSQAVKRQFRHERPKPGLYRVRKPVAIEVQLRPAELTVTGRMPPHLEVRRSLPGPFPPARDPAAMEQAIHSTFSKLGETHLELERLTFHNEDHCFVPVSRLNPLRRELTTALEDAWQQERAQRLAGIQHEVCPAPISAGKTKPASARSTFRWSLKVDRIGFLDALEPADWSDLDELLVDITRDQPAILREKLDRWAERLGRERIRLSLPALTRKWEEASLERKIAQLRGEGWHKWETANLSAWRFLELDPRSKEQSLDLATDWSLYTLNRMAARQFHDMGVSRLALSPEDGRENLRSLLAEFGERAVVIVFQDTPLFMAESCAYANLIGGCPGKANCTFESMEMVSSHGEKVMALDYHCRTIVLNQGPFCLAPRLPELAAAGAVLLRADFIYRPYDPEYVRKIWRNVRAGRAVPGGHAANFDQGIL